MVFARITSVVFGCCHEMHYGDLRRGWWQPGWIVCGVVAPGANLASLQDSLARTRLHVR